MRHAIRTLTIIATSLLGLAAWTSSQAADGPAKPAAEPPAKELKLFDGKTLTNWKILDKIDFDGHGKVEVVDGELILNIGKPMTGIRWGGPELPRTNYEVTFEGRRLDGNDFFCGMTFPVDKAHCSLVLGGWGGTVTGLSSLDGFDASENETTGSMDFKQNKWYKVRLQVTPEKIRAWIDDEQMVNVKIEGRKISLRWEMDSMPPFGIATYVTKGGFKNLVIRRL